VKLIRQLLQHHNNPQLISRCSVHTIVNDCAFNLLDVQVVLIMRIHQLNPSNLINPTRRKLPCLVYHGTYIGHGPRENVITAAAKHGHITGAQLTGRVPESRTGLGRAGMLRPRQALCVKHPTVTCRQTHTNKHTFKHVLITQYTLYKRHTHTQFLQKSITTNTEKLQGNVAHSYLKLVRIEKNLHRVRGRWKYMVSMSATICLQAPHLVPAPYTHTHQRSYPTCTHTPCTSTLHAHTLTLLPCVYTHTLYLHPTRTHTHALTLRVHTHLVPPPYTHTHPRSYPACTHTPCTSTLHAHTPTLLPCVYTHAHPLSHNPATNLVFFLMRISDMDTSPHLVHCSEFMSRQYRSFNR
jgi:hypothetical protein